MIKVIASDMDGTLLNSQHTISERTVRAIKKATDAGIRFIIATGRCFDQAILGLNGAEIECDYIVSSGAEVRNQQKKIVHSGCMDMKDCKEVHDILKKHNLTYTFATEQMDFCIGEEGDLERSLLGHILAFNQHMTEEEVKASDFYNFMISKTKMVPSFEALEASGARITKIFSISDDLALLDEIREELKGKENLAVASSFQNNLEITDVNAQKGNVLKDYIESLGYTMDEVMVLGDSMNDYSMLAMDFGATIAMENGMEPVKEAAKYVTKSNDEDGVAYAIEELLKLYTL